MAYDKIPIEALENQGSGGADRDLLINAAGNMVEGTQASGGSVNKDLFTIHIDNPSTKRYILVERWDKSGTVLNCSAGITGGTSVTYTLEKLTGTNLVTHTDIEDIVTKAANSTSRKTLNTAGTANGSDDFVAGDGLSVDITGVSGSVTTFALNVQANRP